MNSKIFFVIPVYKESPEILRKTLTDVLDHYSNIIVVNDGTPAINYENYIEDLKITYLKHHINLGQGAAIQTGVDYALQKGAEIIVHFDSDGQHNLSDVPAMIKLISDSAADVVIGSRFLDPNAIKHVPVTRKYILKGATYVNWIFTGMKLTDAHNGLRVMNAAAARKIHITENRQAHATQIIYEIRHHKLKLIEYPTTVYYSDYSLKKGQKNINVFNVFFDLILNNFFK